MKPRIFRNRSKVWLLIISISITKYKRYTFDTWEDAMEAFCNYCIKNKKK